MAVVIADTLAQARDAPKAVQVDYDVLPAIVVDGRCSEAGAAVIHDVAPDNSVYNWHLGDKAATDAAFAKAAHVTKLDLVNNRLVRNAMEPRAALAIMRKARASIRSTPRARTRMWRASFSRPSSALAPEHKLRVVAPDVGGGFGSKIFIYAEETVCVWAAKRSIAR